MVLELVDGRDRGEGGGARLRGTLSREAESVDELRDGAAMARPTEETGLEGPEA